MTETKNILVTGASGFLGRHLSNELEADGFEVRRATRQTTGRGFHAIGDIDQKTDWREALRGIDCVIHLAAVAHRSSAYQRQNSDTYHRVNALGTETLARQARKSGVTRFIFASTIGVHGSITKAIPLVETAPLRPQSPYARSKAAAETLLADLSGPDFAVASLRLPLIFGVDAPGNFGTLLRAICRKTPLPLASVKNRRAFAGTRTVSSFITHWLSQRAFGHEPYLVCHEEQLSTPEFVRAIASAINVDAALMPCPPLLLRLALQALNRRDTANALLDSLEIDLKKSKSTGWRPHLSLEEALTDALSPRRP